MNSEFLTPFMELEDDFCSTRDLAPKGRPAGLERRHSHCPITLPNSRIKSGDAPLVQQQWGQDLCCSVLSHIPFRMDRSVSMISMIEGPPLPPPPGLGHRGLAISSLAHELAPELQCALPLSPVLSPRYKTELCRTFQECGACKYGAKCQFAHSAKELRGLRRHPKYKTEPCRTFHTIGFCPYGARCHFIHNTDELCPGARRSGVPQLRHSISFSGVSSRAVPLLSRACSVSPEPLCTASPDSLYTSPLLPEPMALEHFSCPLSFVLDSGDDLDLHFSAVTEQGSGVLWRCSSQDSVSDSVSEEGYVSSGSRISRSQSPCDGMRLPIFSHMASDSDYTRTRTGLGVDQD
ncbi:mRNA decay activator protein ZFP36L1 [Eucyclogobius newberryi]|uniref:mRNA decay activator protein ZFP36L1 n=1 Tax=Eucyclogobius newberryi TaxID=166745 RepID=UPI003B5A6360